MRRKDKGSGASFIFVIFILKPEFEISGRREGDILCEFLI